MRSINVQIIQPALPRYRKPLFDAIASSTAIGLQIATSTREPCGVTSVRPLPEYVTTIHRTLTFFSGRLYWQRGLKLSARIGRGDVLVINGNLRYLSNFSLWLEAARRRVKVVWWGHLRSSTTSSVGLWIRLLFMRVADRCLLYTEREAQELVTRGMDRARLCYMNNTVDTRAIQTAVRRVSHADLDRFRKQNGLDGRRVLAFVGRLRDDRPTELEVAIKAMKILADGKHDYKLLVIGDGRDRERLERLARQVGVQGEVRFVGAVYDESLLANWLGCSDLFVYPGTIGLSLLTAFAYGLPVVTQHQISHHEPEIAALNDGENGLLFRRRDPHDLATKVTSIYGDLDRYRAAARATAYGPFSFERMVKRVIGCIQSAAGA